MGLAEDPEEGSDAVMDNNFSFGVCISRSMTWIWLRYIIKEYITTNAAPGKTENNGHDVQQMCLWQLLLLFVHEESEVVNGTDP